MGIFGKKVAKAQSSKGGVWWLPGKYLVQIDVIKIHEGDEGEFFVLEGDTLESNNERRTAGDKASWVMSMKKRPTFGNIKDFVVSMFGVDPEDEDEISETADAMVDDENPMQGTLARLEVIDKPLKNDKSKSFSLHKWSPVSEEVQAQAEELRKAAGLE